MKYIPNMLTIFRLILIPVYFWIFYSNHPDAIVYALYIFILASATDVLDGYLARKYKVVSKFGMVADPFADKMMQLSVLFSLSDAGYLKNWFFWLILIKEALQISLGVFMMSLKPKLIIPANLFGKATTVLVFVTIILAVFKIPGIVVLQVVVAVLAVITFTQYAYRFTVEYQKRRAQ